jgi:hypothetical protein
MTKLIEDFSKAKQALYDHVGFREDYVIYPIIDRTEVFWITDERNTNPTDALIDLLIWVKGENHELDT